jgi:iron complex outermembrane receptor protein
MQFDKIINNDFRLITIVSVCLVSFCSSLSAQDGGDRRSSGLAIEEITVTAQKREESLQDVPLSVTAFNSEDLDRLNLTATEDLDAEVPGLTVADNGLFDKVITIRGVGNEAARNRSTISGVAFHVDGVFIASTSGLMQDYLDVDHPHRALCRTT